MLKPKFRDNPKEWTVNLCRPPSNVDVEAFQAKLDEVCGLAKGYSIVRLVWGGNATETKTVTVDSNGNATEVIKVPKYRTKIGTGGKRVPTRRWMMEVFSPPEQIRDSLSGFVVLPNAGGLLAPPEFAEKRQKGDYVPFYTIADHSKCDPETCTPENYSCPGDYRAPGEEDLEKLRRANARMKADRENVQFDQFAPVPDHAINLWQKRSDDEREQDDLINEENLIISTEDVENTLKKHSIYL